MGKRQREDTEGRYIEGEMEGKRQREREGRKRGKRRAKGRERGSERGTERERKRRGREGVGAAVVFTSLKGQWRKIFCLIFLSYFCSPVLAVLFC
jgi:hypothetical protein